MLLAHYRNPALAAGRQVQAAPPPAAVALATPPAEVAEQPADLSAQENPPAARSPRAASRADR